MSKLKTPKLTHLCVTLIAPAVLAFAVPAAGDNANIFRVIQATGANYVPDTGPVACAGGTCRTKLEPARVIDLGAQNMANTALLRADLAAQKPAYTIAGYRPSLNIDFKITDYRAINNGVFGGQLVVDYVGQVGFVPPANLTGCRSSTTTSTSPASTVRT